MRKDLIVAVLLTFCLTATLFMVATTQSQEYDPWADLNGDGKIDILDVVGVTGIYALTGDPTKNVTVTNWPVSEQVAVCWARTSDLISSTTYYASGFGHIHLIWDVDGLVDPESVIIRLYAAIYSLDGHSSHVLLASTLTVTSSNKEGALSFPVPAEEFTFDIDLVGATTASVDLSFYLTYA